MSRHEKDENLDQGVIDGFGHEWAVFNYAETETVEALDSQFATYCVSLDLSHFDPAKSVAFDFGAGSGRWSSRLAPYFRVCMHLSQVTMRVRYLKINLCGIHRVWSYRKRPG